jgi:hypothetical protein
MQKVGTAKKLRTDSGVLIIDVGLVTWLGPIVETAQVHDEGQRIMQLGIAQCRSLFF